MDEGDFFVFLYFFYGNESSRPIKTNKKIVLNSTKEDFDLMLFDSFFFFLFLWNEQKKEIRSSSWERPRSRSANLNEILSVLWFDWKTNRSACTFFNSKKTTEMKWKWNLTTSIFILMSWNSMTSLKFYSHHHESAAFVSTKHKTKNLHLCVDEWMNVGLISITEPKWERFSLSDCIHPRNKKWNINIDLCMKTIKWFTAPPISLLFAPSLSLVSMMMFPALCRDRNGIEGKNLIILCFCCCCYCYCCLCTRQRHTTKASNKTK